VERSTLIASDGVPLLRRTFAPRQPARAAIAAHHGLGDHGGFYEELGEELARQGIAMSIHDTRGHGLTPGQRGHVASWNALRDDLALEVAALRREQLGVPLFLLGNSLGGLVVLDYVRRRPAGIAGVVTLSPAVGDVGVPAWVLSLGRVLSRVWPTFSLDSRLDRRNLTRDAERLRRFNDDPLYHTLGSARLSTEFAATLAALIADAGAIRAPLLILHGAADRIALPEASRALFAKIGSPDKERKEYEGAVHNLLHDTNREEVIADVARWIEGRLALTSPPG